MGKTIIPLRLIKENPSVADADNAADARESVQAIEREIEQLSLRLDALPLDSDPLERAALLVDLGAALARLQRLPRAWAMAREAFDHYARAEAWEGAVHSCEVLYTAEQPQSLNALGHGVWLSVTYPVDPELTVQMLQHLVDETPPESDGAAVAAAAAYYITDLRCHDERREGLLYYTNQMLTTVGRRHSGCQSQQDFDDWFRHMDLHEPSLFLPRLGRIVDLIVQDGWWIDRDALRAKLPPP